MLHKLIKRFKNRKARGLQPEPKLPNEMVYIKGHNGKYFLEHMKGSTNNRSEAVPYPRFVALQRIGPYGDSPGCTIEEIG